MTKFLNFLQRLLKKQPKPTDIKQTMVWVDVSAIVSRPEGGHAFALGLHDALSRREIGCAIIDAEEWIVDIAIDAGHFHPEPEGHLIDSVTGRPRWERSAKKGISWLFRNRQSLLKSAFNAGGDAEVVIVLHREDFMSLMISSELPREAYRCLVSIYPAEPGSIGFVASAMGNNFGPPIRFGANGLDDHYTWDKLAKRLTGGI